MKIRLIQTGKTEEEYLIKGIAEYEKRVKRYIDFSCISLPSLKNTKNLTTKEQKQKEAEEQLRRISDNDYVILLDENGQEHCSLSFAKHLDQVRNTSKKTLSFIIGGPYGFGDKLYARANEKISLSKMTFSHQMIRLFFMEQLYRAFTIIERSSYHHE